MAAAVDTANYALIAKADEQSAIDAQADKAERAATRDARIAAAVQRSKTEYQEQHAFTERKVCELNQMVIDVQWLHDSPSDLRNEAGKAKVDRQRLEYLVTSLCCSDSPRYADALSQILGAADFAKPFAGLTKELVDAGMRCALHEEQLGAAMQLAETTRSAVSAYYSQFERNSLMLDSGKQHRQAWSPSSPKSTAWLNVPSVSYSDPERSLP